MKAHALLSNLLELYFGGNVISDAKDMLPDIKKHIKKQIDKAKKVNSTGSTPIRLFLS
jgi:uncharacterized spore protein YtfJ